MMTGRAGQQGVSGLSARISSGTKDAAASKKDRFLGCLGKLNDRDTQRSARDALGELLQDKAWLTDADTLAMVVHSLCTTGPEHKAFARKEVSHAIARLSSPSCPMRSTVLAPPFLTKLIAQLRRLMQDADSSVRESAGEAMAALAAGLAAEDGASATGGGLAAHPVGRALLECLADGKRELQAAACQALGAAARHLPAPETAVVRDLIKRLCSPSFQAVPALLAALAHMDPATGAAGGLLAASPGAFHPQLPLMVGHAAGTAAVAPSGLCACLGSKDWQARKAAADAVRAAALVLGPALEGDGSWAPADPRSLTHRLMRAMEGPRYDKVKEVRDTARDAAALLEELMGFGRSGGSPGAWASTHAVPSPRTQQPQHRPLSASPPRERPSSSPLQRQGSLAERFRRAAGEQDVVLDLASRASPGRPPRVQDVEQAPSTSEAPAVILADAPDVPKTMETRAHTKRSSGGGGTGASVESPGAPVATSPPLPPRPARANSRDMGGAHEAAPTAGSAAMQTVTVPLVEWQGLQRQLRDMEARQSELTSQLAAMSAASTRTISQLQDHIAALEAQLMQQQGPDGQHAQHTHQARAMVGRRKVAVGSEMGGVLPRATAPIQAPAPLSPPRMQPSARDGHTTVTASAASPTPIMFPPLPAFGTASRLGAAADASGQKGAWEAAGSDKPPSSPPGHLTADDLQKGGWAPSVSPLASPRPSPGAHAGFGPNTLPDDPAAADGDLNAAYEAALAAGPHSGVMQRLLARTGAAWGGLQSGVARRLLAAFTPLLKDPFTLPRVMPWMWRLADEQQAGPCVPGGADGLTPDDQAAVLAGIEDAAAAWHKASHPEMAAKLALLRQTLASHWGTEAAGLQPPLPPAHPPQARSARPVSSGVALSPTHRSVPAPLRPASAFASAASPTAVTRSVQDSGGVRHSAATASRLGGLASSDFSTAQRAGPDIAQRMDDDKGDRHRNDDDEQQRQKEQKEQQEHHAAVAMQPLNLHPTTEASTPGGSSVAAAAAAAGSTPHVPMPPQTQHPSGGGRPQLAGLNMLRAELDDLERNFLQSPAFLKARALTEAAKERASSVSAPLTAAADGIVSDAAGLPIAELPPPKLPSVAPALKPGVEQTAGSPGDAHSELDQRSINT